MKRLLALSLSAILPALAMAAGPKKPKSAKAPGAAASAHENVIWKGAQLISRRFDDEAKSLGAVCFDSDSFPHQESSTRILWSLEADSEPKARQLFSFIHADLLLMPLGWKKISQTDYDQYLRNYKNFLNLGAASRMNMLIYRPKDEATYRQFMDGIELLGNRTLGRRIALVPQIFLIVELEQFSFRGGRANFMIKFRPTLYGSCLDDRPGASASLGEIEPRAYVADKLLEQVMSTFKEHRSRMAPGFASQESE